jgi:hypothetical protein
MMREVKPTYVICRLLLVTALILFTLNSVTAYSQEGNSNKGLKKTGIHNLIGVWEAQKTSKGGLGAIYEFREDGGWVGTLGAMVDEKNAGPNPLIKHFAEHPEDKNTEQIQKVMNGPDGSPAFVGVWKYRHYTGGFAYERILPDGHTMLRIPFPLPWGKYEVSGKTIRLSMPGCPLDIVSYRIIKDNTLELTSKNKVKGKNILKLRRVQPTWYHALTESEVDEAKAAILKNKQKMENTQLNEDTKGYEIMR